MAEKPSTNRPAVRRAPPAGVAAAGHARAPGDGTSPRRACPHLQAAGRPASAAQTRAGDRQRPTRRRRSQGPGCSGGPCPPHLVSLRAGPRQPVAPESSAASLLVILGLGQRLELSVGELEVEGSEVFLKCSRESVPGIGSIVGERRSSQARTTCAGVAPWRSAISATSGRAPPFNGK